ncbi:MAG: PHP domain-containing protein [Verrucomicrobia bacterium]|nr:PHP domain-containing protein [Verrucomicrobiota bacterium]
MTRSADLHLHTRHSDGTFTSAEVVTHARTAELACISLTDHDTVAGLAEMTHLCDEAKIEFIPGIELTAHREDREVHILGYFVRHEAPEFVEQIERFKQARAERIIEMISRLRKVGVELQEADLAAVADNGTALGRLHVARALLNRGFIQHLDEAFHRYIGRGRPAFVPKMHVGVAEATSLIHRFGGVAILAHPGISSVDSHLDHLFAEGLDGIEVWHSRHSPHQCEKYLAWARARGCLITGGSDCHGYAKAEVLIGGIRLDYSYVERLKEFHDRLVSKTA